MNWLEDCKEALTTMAELYVFVQIIDLKAGAIYSIKANREVDAVLQADMPLQDRLARLMAKATVRGQHQPVESFIDLQTLPQRMCGNKRLSLSCYCAEHGWGRGDFIRMGDADPLTRVIFALEDINSQKEHEGLMQQTVDLLAESYSAIYYANLLDQSVQPVRMNEVAQWVVSRQKEKLSPRSLMKTYIDSFIHPDDAADMMRLIDLDYLQERLKTEPCIFHVYRTHTQGVDTYYRMKIMKLAERQILVCAFENIDQEVKGKIKLAQEQERYNMLINGLSREYSSVWYIDAALDTVSLVRSNATSQTTKAVLASVKDVSYEKVIRAYIDTFVVPEDRERLYQQTSIAELLRQIPDDDVYRIDYARQNLDGQQCHFQACYARDINATGSQCFIAGFRDVQSMFMAEQRKQKELAEARRVAEAANASKTNFLFNMSHDIRTPMNAIMGFRDLLEKYQDDPARRKRYLDKIKEASKVLLSIINNVLEMARIEKGKLALEEAAYNVHEFAASLYVVLEDMMQARKITVTYELKVEHPCLYGDTTKLREIYLNILSNACKYTEPGGRVTVVCEELPAAKPGWGIFRSTITDTGIGMAADFLPHVFDEFSRENNTTSTKIEGTGLGMSIVKRLVALMDGTIEMQSEKGVGTTCIVSIPHRFAAAAEISGEQIPAAAVSSLKGVRILLAEDNEINAEITMTILQEAGILIDHAADGRICVDMLRAAPDAYYDLILMDVQMPNLNGYEAARQIRALPDAAKAGIPILAMTANAFEEDRQEALKAGMNGHLAKPIETKFLLQTLADLFHAESSIGGV